MRPPSGSLVAHGGNPQDRTNSPRRRKTQGNAHQESGNLLEEKSADLKIYQLQLQRILRFTLYFLEIKCDGKTINKIGVTSRKMSAHAPRASFAERGG